MKTIPSTFRKWGSTWTLLKRSEKRALYHRVSDEGFQWWEVLGVRVELDDVITRGPRFFPAGEYLRMGETDYGQYSWCCTSLRHAERRFEHGRRAAA